MKLEEIQNLWEEDAKINEIFLDGESNRTHSLHHKYYCIYNAENLALKQLEINLKLLYKDKFDLFSGTIDEETLKKRGWLQCGEKILKSNITLYIETDKEYLREEYKVDLQKQKIEFLKDIIKQINARNFIIKNSIDFKKFTSGVA